MFEIITLLTLALVILGQAIERYFFSKLMTQKLNDCMKAVMSRNINEYISAVNSEKTPARTFTQPDEVLLSDADDELFDKFIEQQTK